ncbi:MAG: hypothetical protein GF414_00345 [Candidatus Altiarchaeales archaeon]|nr:hypothetical protein [Candidatus Altiarchaeales archaeon]
MANTYADIIRLEGTLAGVTGIVRSGAFAVTTDHPRRIVMKRAAGGYNHWTCDEDWDPGATGVSYTNQDYPTITTVQEALDNTLASSSGYYVGTGLTGVPIWGDGVIEPYITQIGSAIYSEDGHVYFMGEAGFTGLVTQAGCKFVVNPIPIGDDLKFVHGGASTDEYSYIGYTGAGSDANAELYMVTAQTTLGNTAHIRLETGYGRIKLTTGSATSSANGIVLSGYDGASAQYSVASAGKYRSLYADEDGGMVVSDSDLDNTYTTGGFTAMISDSYFDTASYGYVEYQIVGHCVYMTWPQITGASISNSLQISGIPAAVQPSDERNVCMMYIDNASVTGGVPSMGRLKLQASSTATAAVLRVDGSTGEPKLDWSGFETGVVGVVGGQTITYQL